MLSFIVGRLVSRCVCLVGDRVFDFGKASNDIVYLQERYDDNHAINFDMAHGLRKSPIKHYTSTAIRISSTIHVIFSSIFVLVCGPAAYHKYRKGSSSFIFFLYRIFTSEKIFYFLSCDRFRWEWKWQTCTFGLFILSKHCYWATMISNNRNQNAMIKQNITTCIKLRLVLKRIHLLCYFYVLIYTFDRFWTPAKNGNSIEFHTLIHTLGILSQHVVDDVFLSIQSFFSLQFNSIQLVSMVLGFCF